MSSVLDKLENKALDALDKHGEDWLEKAIDGGRKELAKLSLDEPETAAIRAMGEMALVKIDKHKAALADLGYQRACAFLGRVAIGQNERAASILTAYGGGAGAWGAADSVVAAGGNATEAAKRAQDEALALAKDIGATVAKSALPILLSMVAV